RAGGSDGGSCAASREDSLRERGLAGNSRARQPRGASRPRGGLVSIDVSGRPLFRNYKLRAAGKFSRCRFLSCSRLRSLRRKNARVAEVSEEAIFHLQDLGPGRFALLAPDR